MARLRAEYEELLNGREFFEALTRFVQQHEGPAP